MRLLRLVPLLILVCLPTQLLAELANGELPAARWYAHIDLVAMRQGEAGKKLYAWLESEVFEELHEELGFDASREADVITAVATPEGGIMVVVEGNFSQLTKDRILAVGAAGSNFNEREFDGSPYYFIGDDNGPGKNIHDNDSFDDGGYLSLSSQGKLLITSTEEQMQALIKGKGKIPGDQASDGGLIVLSAKQNLVQAGMRADDVGKDLGWDSNMLQNTEQVALLVAEVAGKLSLEAQLIANEAQVASSLASIVRGLISLQIFSDELEPGIAAMLQSTTVDVDGVRLIVKLALDPQAVIDLID